MEHCVNKKEDEDGKQQHHQKQQQWSTATSREQEQLDRLRKQRAEEERALQRELASAIERLAPLDEIRILLAGGAQVDGPVNQGLKPIHYAAYNDFLPAVKLLILRGCDINAMDDNGYTPVHWAAERGFYDLLEFLIENKAKVCFNENRKLRTTSSVADEPLSLALRRNHLECARLLLEAGADPNTRYFMGHEINLINILRTNAIELLLKHGADANARDRTGLTPLMLAARHPQGYKTVELLIGYGADVNAYASERHDYRTVLHHSIFSGSIELIKLLLTNGANYPDMEPVDKPSPLDIAIISGRHDIVRLLTEFQADSNSCQHTTIGQPLHTALTQRVENKYEIVKILLDSGADVNARQTSNRQTGPPLHDYLHSSRLNANSSPSRNNDFNNAEFPLAPGVNGLVGRGPDPKMVRLLLMYGARVQLTERAKQEDSKSRLGLARLLERVQDELSLDLLHLLIDAAEVIEWQPMSKIIYNCLRIANRPYTNELFDPSVANDMTPIKLKILLNTSNFARHQQSFKAHLLKLMEGDEPKWAVLSLKQICRIKLRKSLLINNQQQSHEVGHMKGATLIRHMSDLPIPFILKKYLFYQE